MTERSWLRYVGGWVRVLKYPLILGLVAGVVWYVRNQPMLVTGHEVKRGVVVQSVFGTGTLEARVRTTISPKIPGRIAEVLVDQGSMVKAGQLLVRLDDEDLAQQVRMAVASISSAEATLGRFRAEIAQAKSTFAKTEADLRRTETLLRANSISQSEYDQTKEAFELAKSGLLRAESNLLEGEQQVRLHQETLKYQEARLGDTKLVAPFDGLVIERQRDAGAIVVPGSPILQLISLEELWISAWVDETEMDQLKDHQKAKIVFRSQPNAEFEGVVTRLGKQSDRETREFTVDVRALQLPEAWAIGQRAEVYIETDRVEDRVCLPTSYLVRDGKRLGVYVNEGGVARWRSIVGGISGRETMEIREGLEAGMQVVAPVISGVKLSEGQKVRLP